MKLLVAACVVIVMVVVAGVVAVFAWDRMSLRASTREQPERAGTELEPYTSCGVANFAWTERGVVARGAQPSQNGLKCLSDAGFKAVVELQEEGAPFDEESAAKSLGMDYLYISIVNDTAPSPVQVKAYLGFIDSHRQANEPVFTHDAAGRGRMGFMDGLYLLRKDWSTTDVFDRYIKFGAKIGCEKGGNGQVQALHEIGLLFGRGDAWPQGQDTYGTKWADCKRPDYMAGWDYRIINSGIGTSANRIDPLDEARAEHGQGR